MKRIKGKELFNIAVLTLLLITEWFVAYGGIHEHYENWLPYSLISISLLVIILVAGFCCHAFSLKTLNFTNLLASAIVPKRLTIVYLLGFVMHLSWMTDGVLNYLVGDPWLYTLIIGAAGVFILFIAFPDNRTNEGRKKTKVFVSGLSLFPQNPNPITHKPVEYRKFNLIPLVRILQLAENECDDCVLLILKTQEYANSIPVICIDKAEDLKLNVIEEDDYQYYGIKKDNALDDRLRLIIKKTAWNEFVTPVIDEQMRAEKEKWLRDSVKIHFTAPCDYDNYPECFKELSKSLIDFDTNENMLIFNLTPGPAVISSVMTILSIDSGRDLYYYKQNAQGDIAEQLQEVDKTKIPLENLLSQALEKIKKQ